MGLKRRRQEDQSADGPPTVMTTRETTQCVTTTSHHPAATSAISLLLMITCILVRPGDAFAPSTTSIVGSPSLLSSPGRLLHNHPGALRSSLSLDRPIQQQRRRRRPLSSTEFWDKTAFQIQKLSPLSPTTTTTIMTTTNLEPPSGPAVVVDPSATVTSNNAPTAVSRSTATASATMHRWKRRLITKEDWKHVHKITGGLFLFSSWGLTGYAVRDLLANGWTVPVTVHGKPFLALLLVLLGSSVIQSFSSIRLACNHRRGQPAVRNTFLCNAAVAILGSVSALWSSAWYPACLNGAFSMAFYFILDAIGLIGMGDNLFRLKALIASRQEPTTTRSRQHSSSSATTADTADGSMSRRVQYWKDVFVYMMPILIGAPFFVAIGWQFGIRHDRTFYLNLLQRPGHPHLEAGAVYGMIMVAMGASYSSLIVTLRDKKLIRKSTEGLSLTAVMVCLVGSLYQAMRDPGTVAMIMGM